MFRNQKQPSSRRKRRLGGDAYIIDWSWTTQSGMFDIGRYGKLWPYEMRDKARTHNRNGQLMRCGSESRSVELISNLTDPHPPERRANGYHSAATGSTDPFDETGEAFGTVICSDLALQLSLSHVLLSQRTEQTGRHDVEQRKGFAHDAADHRIWLSGGEPTLLMIGRKSRRCAEQRRARLIIDNGGEGSSLRDRGTMRVADIVDALF